MVVRGCLGFLRHGALRQVSMEVFMTERFISEFMSANQRENRGVKRYLELFNFAEFEVVHTSNLQN